MDQLAAGRALELFSPVFRPLTPDWTAWTPYNTLGYAEKVRSQFLSLRHVILKYNANFRFSIIDRRISLGAAGFVKIQRDPF